MENRKGTRDWRRGRAIGIFLRFFQSRGGDDGARAIEERSARLGTESDEWQLSVDSGQLKRARRVRDGVSKWSRGRIWSAVPARRDRRIWRRWTWPAKFGTKCRRTDRHRGDAPGCPALRTQAVFGRASRAIPKAVTSHSTPKSDQEGRISGKLKKSDGRQVIKRRKVIGWQM
jgi:hypothetical protein